ncbi:SCO7613 C-terminal domain-containing membrane protein [Streptomyces sp. NPDC048718]|uniref:SCO7613 C-terminal domain-containing membrane protein n=1 Tax=Streptomyces sp. NPDC048718 TaxID=3365587 RepID=UPI00371C4E91
MESSLPPAEELVLVDRELARLDAHRAQLLLRRDWLLRVLRPQTQARAPVAWGPPGGPPAPGASWPAPPAPRPEATPHSTQNVLLTLGGALLTVAALVFTLVSWGSMGIGGRAVVLAVVTSAALLAPVGLLRRGLAATAEAVAALGLVLTVLDAYAVQRVALPETGFAAYAAGASVALAAAWAAYGSALRGLRIPWPAAVAVAQPAPLLAVWALDGGLVTFVWAALVTAAVDLVPALRAGLPASVRAAAAAGAGLLGGWALATGLVVSSYAPGRAAAPLLAVALVLLYLATRHAPAALAAATAAGVAVLAASGGLLRQVVPADWAVPGYALCAVLLAAVALRAGIRAGRAVRHGLAAAGAGVLALTGLWALPPVVAGLLGPLARTGDVWSGTHATPVLTGFPATAPVVPLLAAGALTFVPRLWARCAALGCGWALLTALPVSLELPYAASVTLRLATAAAGLALGAGVVRAARRSPVVGWLAYGCGLASAVGAVAPALDVRGATFAVLGVLAVLFAGVAVRADGARRLVGAGAAVVTVAGLVCAGAAAAQTGLAVAGLLLLAVPAGTAGLGAWLGRRSGLGLPGVMVEATGAGVGLCGLAAASARPELLALGLALGGTVAAATALRPARRPLASWAAAALFVSATWVRLALWEVTAPEAYALPPAALALVVGVVRRRRDPETSSGVAYGPGLTAALVPSLCAAWADPSWVRPLLLGLAALTVTLLGARFRLRAPLLLGGVVLVLNGLHELAPYVVQVVGALPRWLPPALAGGLLLAVGATYEQRLRDARRLRDRLGRMR